MKLTNQPASPSALLKQLFRQGLTLTLGDGRLNVGPADKITPDQHELIQRHSTAIFDILSRFHPAPTGGAIARQRTATDSCRRHVSNEDAELLWTSGYVSWTEFTDEYRASIEADLAALPRGLRGPGEALFHQTQKFIQSIWFEESLIGGWDNRALFGVDQNAPDLRTDCWGLISAIALLPPGWEIETLGRDSAIVCHPGEMPVTFHRGALGNKKAVEWWTVTKLIRPN